MNRIKSTKADDASLPPPHLPADGDRFWQSAVDLSSIAAFPEKDSTPVLKLLGPLPFPRGGFPVMGFLATLYEHVAKCARDALDGGSGDPHIQDERPA